MLRRGRRTGFREQIWMDGGLTQKASLAVVDEHDNLDGTSNRSRSFLKYHPLIALPFPP